MLTAAERCVGNLGGSGEPGGGLLQGAGGGGGRGGRGQVNIDMDPHHTSLIKKFIRNMICRSARQPELF